MSPEFAARYEADSGMGEPRVRIDRTTEGTCRCGCGEQLSNPKRSFRQGHDARYKGILQIAYRNNIELGIEEGGMLISSDALTEAERFGWERFMTEAPKRSAKAVKRVTIKVGRWTHEATISGGVATYTNRSGKVVSTSKYKLA